MTWIYKVRTVRVSLVMDTLEAMGAEGWELAGVRPLRNEDRLYFKKMVIE